MLLPDHAAEQTRIRSEAGDGPATVVKACAIVPVVVVAAFGIAKVRDTGAAVAACSEPESA